MSRAARSRHASMAADPVSPEVAHDDGEALAPLRQLVVEQAAHQLEGHVLEGERRPVEQLEQPGAVAQVDQGAHVRVVERRRRPSATMSAKVVRARAPPSTKGHITSRATSA